MKDLFSSVKEVVEYKTLEKCLLENNEISSLVKEKEELRKSMLNLDEMSDDFKKVKDLYDIVSDKLYSNEEYVRFKYLEREINLFVMHCNKEIKKLFDLNKK